MLSRLATTFLFLTCLAGFAQDTSPAADHVISSASAEALLIKRINPIYPPLARQARIQGTVVLEVKITKSGDVESVQLFSGHPMLAPAAIEAVKQWKYKPAEVDGEPAEVKTTVQVIFNIAGEKPQEPNAPNSETPPTNSPESDASSAVPQRVRVSSGVAGQLLLSKVSPIYPPDARKHGIQGVVLLKITIGKDGSVSSVELISGHPLLAPAAIDAVNQWKYHPYLLNNIPVEVETQAQVNFALTRR